MRYNRIEKRGKKGLETEGKAEGLTMVVDSGDQRIHEELLEIVSSQEVWSTDDRKGISKVKKLRMKN